MNDIYRVYIIGSNLNGLNGIEYTPTLLVLKNKIRADKWNLLTVLLY